MNKDFYLYFNLHDEDTYNNFNVEEIKIFMALIEACKICVNVFTSLETRHPAIICLECSETAELIVKFKCYKTKFLFKALVLFVEICTECKNVCSKYDLNEARKTVKLCEMCLEVANLELKNK